MPSYVLEWTVAGVDGCEVDTGDSRRSPELPCGGVAAGWGEVIVRRARDEPVWVPRWSGGGDASGMCKLVAFLADKAMPDGMVNVFHLLTRPHLPLPRVT
ncbi:hypothetical protein GCM10010276_57420 [Streptomyces longisporus]|uniref:Uncharacterized protein n=1 Tax=Streptomyces longisporus TaxID=1948 RepID=A0ABN3MNV5_STRLO